MAFLLKLGAEVADEHGDPMAPVALVLQTYCRNPKGNRIRSRRLWCPVPDAAAFSPALFNFSPCCPSWPPWRWF